jgi:hypothetical protein
MKILIFIAVFLTAIHMRVCAQHTTAHVWPLQALQADCAIFPLGYSVAVSWSVAVDIDFVQHKHVDGSVTLYGCQLGFSQFDWPYYEFSEWQNYGGSDFDLLLRHTYRYFAFRTDLVTGLSIRHGDYENTRTGAEFWGQREESVTAGLKIGGAVTLMLLNPAIALRFKAQGRLFGFKTLEGGALGLGLVLGWQRDD